MVNLRDKKHALSKPKHGIVWTEHPGLSEKQRDAALIASERLIARAELKEADARTEQAKKAGKKKVSNKSKTASWMFSGITTMLVTGWNYRTFGSAAAISFLSWRVWRFLGLGSVVSNAYYAALAGVQAVEDFQSVMEFAGELYDNGDLEKIVSIIGVTAGLGYLCWVYNSQPPSESGALSDSDSDSDTIVGGDDVGDSDDEPDAKALFSELARGQAELASAMIDLKDRMQEGRLPTTPSSPPSSTTTQEQVSSPAGGSGEGSGPSAADIDAFIKKLNEHEGVVERDSGKATGAPSPTTSSGSSGSWDKVGSSELDDPLKDQIVQLRLESTNPKDSLLRVLQQYRPTAGSQVGGVKARVSPTVLAKLYRGGRTARAETQEWLRSKELQQASVANEVNMLAMVLDRMMTAGEHDALINSQAAELTCLRLYSIWKAYERVVCRGDWQRPKQQNNGKWKSKVDWSLAEEYLRLEGDRESENLKADEEVLEKLKRRAVLNKHLSQGREGTGGGDGE